MQFKLIRSNRNYRKLLCSSAASNLGDGIALLALPWLATLISRDAVHVSWIAFATRLPWFLFSIPAGVIIDRVNRQNLMVLADVVRTLLSVGLMLFVLQLPVLPLAADEVSRLNAIMVLTIVSFLLGIAEVFRDNAAQTVLPSLVAGRELERANGQLWSLEQIMGSFVGPPLAGFLMAVSLTAPFGFNVAIFAVSAWFLWQLRFPARKSAAAPGFFHTELVAGLAWLRGHRLMLQLAIMLGLLNAFTVMALTVLVLFSQEVLHLNAVGHGLLLTSVALGGVAGGFICPAIAEKLGQQASLYLALLIFPAGFFIIYLATSPVLVAFALFMDMFASILWNIVTVSYRQRVIPDSLLGRVNSIYRFFGWGMMPIGALAAGWIVAVAEPVYGREHALALPYLCAAAGCLLVLLYALRWMKFSR